MASKRRLSKEEQNFIRFVKTCTDIIKLPLKDILASEIQPIDLYTKIQSSCLLTDRRSRLGSDQLKICYIPPPSTPDYDKFDVTLLYKLIRNLCPSLKPTQGWDVDPLNSDILIGDDIERLRLFRNNCVHGSSTKILDSDFEDRWKRLKCVILRIQTYMTLKGGNPNYEGELTVMRQLDLGDETLEEFKKTYIVEHTYDRLKNNIDKPFITISGTEKVFCGEIARFKVIVSPKDLGGWSVKWQKLNGDVSTHIDLNKEKYSRPTDRELIIHSVCREDEGIYQAYLSQESNGSNFKVLGNVLCLQTVGELPAFDLWKVTKGKEGINIHYKVKENKPFVTKIRWTKDGDPLDYGSKKYIGGDLKDGYITITSPITEDRGTYTCMVTNAVGTVHKDVTIDCPSVQISSTELVYFGCKTEISPNISSCPSVDEIEWQKSSDGNTFKSVDIGEPKYYGSSRDPESALLVLPKVKFEDKLYYRLFAWNKIGEQYSNIIYLNVTGSPPNIVVNHRTYIENNSVELIASVFSSEKLLVVQKVVWTKDGKEVDIDGSGGKYSKVNAQNPSLTIFDVNKHDAGSYQLTATNIVGSTKSDDIILGIAKRGQL